MMMAMLCVVRLWCCVLVTEEGDSSNVCNVICATSFDDVFFCSCVCVFDCGCHACIWCVCSRAKVRFPPQAFSLSMQLRDLSVCNVYSIVSLTPDTDWHTRIHIYTHSNTHPHKHTSSSPQRPYIESWFDAFVITVRWCCLSCCEHVPIVW